MTLYDLYDLYDGLYDVVGRGTAGTSHHASNFLKKYEEPCPELAGRFAWQDLEGEVGLKGGKRCCRKGCAPLRGKGGAFAGAGGKDCEDRVEAGVDYESGARMLGGSLDKDRRSW